MTADAIAWIEGRWGAPGELSLPLNDRGLQLADGLFETVLIQNGQARLLEEHLGRWADCAVLLGMDPPPDQQALLPLIEDAMQRMGLGQGCGALRLNWSRGVADHRGIGLSGGMAHRFWLTLHRCQPLFGPKAVLISRSERRNADSLLSRCKSFAYGQAVQARREASQQGADDALLLNTQGTLCCGTAANLLVQRGGQWLTPPLTSGCLPGVMRGRGLETGLVQEAELGSTLQPHDQAVLINSLSCHPIDRVNGQVLATSDGEALWQGLLR